MVVEGSKERYLLSVTQMIGFEFPARQITPKMLTKELRFAGLDDVIQSSIFETTLQL